MDKPLVSIIMPVYNVDSYVKEAIESIINQTYTNYELLVVDDCSSDNTTAIVNSFKDRRISLFCNEKNKGISYNMNRGIELSKGIYIARMDGDDVAVNTRIEKQVEFMETHPEVTASGTNIEFIFKNKLRRNRNELFLSWAMLKLHFLAACNIYQPTVIMRKKDIVKYGLFYDVNTRLCEDYDYWSKMIVQRNIANIPDKLLYYRIHNNSVSQRTRESWVNHEDVVRQNYLELCGCDKTTAEILIKAVSGKLESVEECNLFQNYYEDFTQRIILNPNDSEKIVMNRILSYIYRVNAHLGIGILKIYWDNRFSKYRFIKKDDLHLILKLLIFNVINIFNKED